MSERVSGDLLSPHFHFPIPRLPHVSPTFSTTRTNESCISVPIKDARPKQTLFLSITSPRAELPVNDLGVAVVQVI